MLVESGMFIIQSGLLGGSRMSVSDVPLIGGAYRNGRVGINDRVCVSASPIRSDGGCAGGDSVAYSGWQRGSPCDRIGCLLSGLLSEFWPYPGKPSLGQNLIHVPSRMLIQLMAVISAHAS